MSPIQPKGYQPMGQLMQTRYGAIDVTLQDGRTAYVRAGTGDRDDATMDGLVEVPRAGEVVRGRAHFALEASDADWAPLRGHMSFRRGGSDLTPAMERALAIAITDALAEVDVEDLDAAQYAKNASEAAERRAQARGLQEMATQLIQQAQELEADRGARVVYLEQRLRSGMTQEATAVRTSAGELLFVDEPKTYIPFLAHDGRGLRRYIDESAEWKER